MKSCTQKPRASISSPVSTTAFSRVFDNLMANEVVKAQVAVSNYNRKEGWNAYSGTSFSTLVSSPSCGTTPIFPNAGIDCLAKQLANTWVQTSTAVGRAVEKIFPKDELRLFQKHGVFYAAELSPKAIAFSLGHHVSHSVLDAARIPDLYNFPYYKSTDQKRILKVIEPLVSFPISVTTLCLADSCHPRERLPASYVIPPVTMNEILASLLHRTQHYVTRLSRARGAKYAGSGPHMLLSADTDNPYRVAACRRTPFADGVLPPPAMTLLAATGRLHSPDLLMLCRLALIAQFLRGNVLSCSIRGYYTPFTFFGIGTARDIESGFLALDEFAGLRYPGLINLSEELRALQRKLSRVWPAQQWVS